MPYTPDVTKAAVFEAAIAEFAAHGFAGARIDRIAVAAHADKTAIYSYFGNKQALFEAVLASELGQLSAKLPVDESDLPGTLGRFFDYQRAHPHHLRLLMWEALEFGGDAVPAESVRGEGYRARARQLDGAQRSGGLDPSLDTAGLWLILAGMVNWPLALPQVARMTIGSGDEALEKQRELLVECARRLLASSPRDD